MSTDKTQLESILPAVEYTSLLERMRKRKGERSEKTLGIKGSGRLKPNLRILTARHMEEVEGPEKI